MRVLHINDYERAGGAEIVVAQTDQLLRASGCQTELFTVSQLPRHRLWPWRYIHNPIACTALEKTLQQFTPDVVHLHNFYHALSPGILKTLAQWRTKQHPHHVRIIATAHDFHLICPNPVSRMRNDGKWTSAPAGHEMSTRQILASRWDHRGRLYSFLRGLQWYRNYRRTDLRRVIDRILCPSRFLETHIAAAGLPTAYLPNPAPQPIKARSKRSPTLQFVFAGRVEPEKGLAEFISMLPDTFAGSLIIVGDGSSLAQCQAVAARRPFANRIQFRGRLSHDETQSVIAQSHVLLLPSLCLENAPNAMFEALSAATNLLVSEMGGMKEVVGESGIGSCFNPIDQPALIANLKAIESAHAAGSLNNFDATAFLSKRTPQAYLEQLMSIYTTG